MACREAVVSVGQWIGQTKRTLVYGGARKGWMELLANTVKERGGRVLGVTAVADTLENAIAKAYEHTKKVHMDHSFYRSDIGQRALKALK